LILLTDRVYRRGLMPRIRWEEAEGLPQRNFHFLYDERYQSVLLVLDGNKQGREISVLVYSVEALGKEPSYSLVSFTSSKESHIVLYD
jgi:hypothetical protein